VFARFAGDLDTEVRLAAELRARGAPVVPPLDGVPARAHEHGGRRVTLWTWWEQSGDEGPAAVGRALASCHRALAAGVEVGLAPWAGLAHSRELLAELPTRERAVVAPHLDPPDVPVRPVHGDAHPGNVLTGPVWHDWEDAQLACVEWDLACLVGPGRVVGMDFGLAEAILAGYDEPYDAAVLDRCVAARTAQQAVWGILLGDAVPSLPERVAIRLEWLASATRA
jgi:Ser/Thr protein kinase RdoA (MazF antagonist)